MLVAVLLECRVRLDVCLQDLILDLMYFFPIRPLRSQLWFIKLFRGSLPFSCSSFDMRRFRFPLLCKERVGEVESVGYQ
jgi:hypothetical protein